MKILLTGATGFIGRQLVDSLLKKSDAELVLVTRTKTILEDQKNASNVQVTTIDQNAYWQDALRGCDVVIHTAARVHVMKDLSDDPLGAFREINVGGTLHLARQAEQAGVKRFIFLSSIKVNGESTPYNTPFQADDIARPKDCYGISKYEAEQGLLSLSKVSKMEVVIIRPVLVYGPGVKGNFRSLLSLVQKGVPLPFRWIGNKRSFLAVENLADFIMCCIEHPKAANQIFLLSDDSDLSTTELIKKIRVLCRRKSVLVPVPIFLMQFLASLVGKKEMVSRLCGSLQVDITKAKTALNWSPIVHMDDVLHKIIKERSYDQ